MLDSFFYLVKQGTKNLTLNAMMSFASIGVLVACMLLMGCSYLFGVNVNSIIGYVETQNEVMVYIDVNAEAGDLAVLESEMGSVNNLISYTFIDKDTALNEWIEDLGDDGALMEVFRYDNPLPDSYRVVVRDLSRIRETVAELEKLTAVELVNAPYDVADSIVGIKEGVESVGNVIIVILLFVSLVVVTNTIRLTVFNRRKEISIMKYVGATDWFIRLPFLVEGILIGIISAIISIVVLYGGYELVLTHISENPLSWGEVSGQLVTFEENAYTLFLGLLASGVAVGSTGSLLFLNRYVKV